MNFQAYKNQPVQTPAPSKFDAVRGARVLLIIISVVAIFCLLLSFARIGIGAWMYAGVEDWVTVKLGFDYYLANLAATIAVAVGTVVLSSFAWYLLTGRGKLYGAFVPIGGWLAMWLLISTVGANVCFDRRTGAPLCYFCDTPQGRVWSRTSGYEPITGRAFTLYTREIYEREQQQSRNAAAITVSSNANRFAQRSLASNSNRTNTALSHARGINANLRPMSNLESSANRSSSNKAHQTVSNLQTTNSENAKTDTLRLANDSAAEAERRRLARERLIREQAACEQAAREELERANESIKRRREEQRYRAEEQRRRDELARQQHRDEDAWAERERRERIDEQRRQEKARRRDERERQIFGIANRALSEVLRRH